ILQVHDELVLEVREDQVDALRAGLLPLMSAGAALDVPLLVEAGVGDNWDQAHDRKSTRLNSSHVKISYAVFCLKKKNYERNFDEGGARYHHILDPKTGRSHDALRSDTVIASTATRTDGTPKTVLILITEKFNQY